MDAANTLRELEASLQTNEVRKDGARISRLLAEEFREFGRSGTIYTRAEIVAFLQAEEPVRIAMKNFVCEMVTESVALVTYVSQRTEPVGEGVESLRSSVWVWREERWQMVFHQGTPLKEATGAGVNTQ